MIIRRKWAIIAFFVLFPVLVIILFLASPVFHITEVIISGNARTPDEEVIARLGVRSTTNLVFFNARNAAGRLMENFFIGDVRFRRELPGRLHVQIEERRLMAYVEHMPGLFLYIDDFGMVVDIRNYTMEARPLLEGLQITRFQKGQELEVPDRVAFNAVVHYSLLLYHHDLIGRVTHMDVSDTANIRILIDYWEFNVGGVMNADEKVRTIIAMLDAMPNQELMRGFTDLREIRPQFFFEILQ